MKRLVPADRYLRFGGFPAPRLVEIAIDGAPAYLRGLRALFLSDVHLRPNTPDAALGALIAQMAACAPDLILLGGDYAESARDCLRFFEALRGLHPALGCFAAPGNNDRWTGLARFAARGEAALLINEARTIALPGGALSIGGVDEHKYGLPDSRDLFPAGAGYRILLSHFPVMPDCACELMLSGHTHAGQFNLLGLTPYALKFERRYAMLAVRGQGMRGSMRYLVGNGVGVSRIPLRVGAEPQLYLLKFSI